MKKILLLCCLLANKSYATDSTSLKNSTTLQGSYTSGNFSNYSIGFRNETKYNKLYNNYELLLLGKITQLQDPSLLKEKEGYMNFAYSYAKNNRKIIVFSEDEYSFLKDIKYRSTLGIGYGYKFINKKEIIFDVSEALMSEIIKYKDKDEFKTLRLSTRIKFILDKYPFNLSTITMIQPPISNSTYIEWKNNLIVRSSTSIGFYVTKKVQVGLVDDYIMNTYTAFRDNSKRQFDNSTNFFVKMNF